MNNRMRKNVQIAVCCICMSVCVTVKAQVTIGSNIVPAKGAMLDLKQFAPNSDNATADTGGGGLVLPRVILSDKNTLEPFIDTSSPEWQAGAAQNKTKSDHIGLLVYNVANNAFFHPGIYVWRGIAWEAMEVVTSYFYLPSFNLEWKDNGTVNLFDIYKNNYNPDVLDNYHSSRSGNIVDIHGYSEEPTDFDYVVTYYDPAVIKIDGIDPNGTMHYHTGASGALPRDAHINVVMIRK